MLSVILPIRFLHKRKYGSDLVRNIKPYDGTNFHEVSELLAIMMKNYTFKNVNDKSKEKFLGVFNYVGSNEPKMLMELERTLAQSDIWIAYDDAKIIGIIRGSRDIILNLFVEDDYTRKGVGTELVQIFEEKCKVEGFINVRLSSAVEAIEFYETIGYKKTTGLRMAKYSGRKGYEYQPMMKMVV